MKFKKLLVSMIIALSLLGCSNADGVNQEKIPTQRIHGSYTIDMSDKEARVGSADYVFVAYVNEVTGTVYKNPRTLETEEGNVEVGDPYTNYTITVIENIKGKLKKNKEIPLQQAGGLSSDSSSYMLYEDDELLIAGNYYVIVVFAQPDGSILASGPFSSELIEVENISEETRNDKIKSTDIYKTYKKAYENEIKLDRKRFKSNNEE